MGQTLLDRTDRPTETQPPTSKLSDSTTDLLFLYQKSSRLLCPFFLQRVERCLQLEPLVNLYNMNDINDLDRTCTVLGEVFRSMEVIDKIVAAARDEADNPLQPITMTVTVRE